MTEVEVKEITLTNDVVSRAAEFIEYNAKWPFPVIPPNVCKGKSVVICGAGPSLEHPDALGAIKHMRDIKGHVWGCNAALPWLKRNNKYVTHGVAVDGTLGMLDVWATAYKMKYLLSSSVNPKLIAHLVEHGVRQVAFFHNYQGTCGKVEFQLYEELWKPSVITGEGLNVVNRVLRLAEYMGYRKIFVAGADCGLGIDESAFHVGGTTRENLGLDKLYGKSQPELEDAIGRRWITTPDMAMSAIDLVKAKRQYGQRLILLGDTVPARLCGQSDEFLDRIIRWKKPEECCDNPRSPRCDVQ